MHPHQSIAIAGLSDPASALTHLGGALLFGVLSILLIRRAARSPTPDSSSRRARVLAVSIFAAATVLALVTSGLFHLCQPGSAKRAMMLRLDSATIFLLIAATYTPVHTILFRGVWRWGFLAFIWSVSIGCLSFKTIYFDDVPRWLSLGAYLCMGWFSVLSATRLWSRYGFRFIRPVVLGGIAYTLGGVLNLVHYPNPIPGYFGAHEIFHIAVLLGLSYHWQFIDQIATCSMRLHIPIEPNLNETILMPSEAPTAQPHAA